MSEIKTSPWGTVDYTEVLADGVIAVSTASHGGILVDVKKHKLSSAALRIAGEKHDADFYAFEEDCAWAVAVFELRKLGHSISPHVSDEDVLNIVKQIFPEYVQEAGII